MGARRRPATHAASAALTVLLSCSLTACGAGDATPAPLAAQPIAKTSGAKTSVENGSMSTPTPLVVPGWLPVELPLPADVQVTGVRTAQCAMSFLAPGTHAEDMSAMLVQRAREAGLLTRVVSSVSSTPPPVASPDALFSDDLAVESVPVTHAVVLEFGEALLTLTSRGDGVVLGAYELGPGACGA